MKGFTICVLGTAMLVSMDGMMDHEAALVALRVAISLVVTLLSIEWLSDNFA